MDDQIIPLLLLPQHLTPTPSRLPFLKAIQVLLNQGYEKSHCAQSEIFGTSYVRLEDPEKVEGIIDESGFTVVLLRVLWAGVDGSKVVELVATGSAKTWTGQIESYARWIKDPNGTEWLPITAAKSGVQNLGGKSDAVKYELTALSVSPRAQAGGLGARVLKELEWLVSQYLPRTASHRIAASQTPTLEGVAVQNGLDECVIEGIDLRKLREQATDQWERINGLPKELQQHELVLICIRELGSEAYYQRRGYKSLWSGTVPVGLWGCKKECTMVYMEKDD